MRLAQIVDGLRTDYVQEVAGPLAQVLAATAGGTTTTRYLHGLGLIGEQRGSEPTGWQYHLPDALGSVRQTVDATAKVTLRRSYEPFGGLHTAEGLDSAYGFAGEEQDATTGHVYLRARTYHPAVGRFLQQDRELGAPMQPATLHRYAYAFNNPVNVVDPTGRMPALGRSVNPANAGGANAIPFSAPARSVNHAGWATYSDPLARQQSRGHEPFYCGAVRFFNQMLRETDRLLSGLDPLQDAIYDRSKGVLAQIPLERLNGYLDGQGDLIVGLTPVDLVYDLVSLALGRDLLSGRELSHLEEGLILFGFVTGGIGDDIGKLGLRALRLTDEAIQTGGRALVRSSDELALAGRRLMHSGKWVGDNIPISSRLARRVVKYEEAAVGAARRLETPRQLRLPYDDTPAAKGVQDDFPAPKRVLVVGENEALKNRRSFDYSRRLAHRNPNINVVGTQLGTPTLEPEIYRSQVIPKLTIARNIDATNLSQYIDEIGGSFDYIVFNAPRALGKWSKEATGKLVDDVIESSGIVDVLRPGGSILFSSSPRMPAADRLFELANDPPRKFTAMPPVKGFTSYEVNGIVFGIKGYRPTTNEGKILNTDLSTIYWFRFLFDS